MDSNVRYPKLLEPSYIGKVKTRNRIVKTANGTGFAHINRPIGYVNDQHKAYYEAFARGGVGLLITEPCPIEYPRGAHRPDIWRIDSDEYIKGHSEITQIVHTHGCPIFLQLLHAGPWHAEIRFKTYYAKYPGKNQPVSSSAIKLPGLDFDMTKALSTAEIAEIVEMAAINIERARKAGYDGVEIDVSTCHLVNSFLSCAWNQRKDNYGAQSIESRTRFPVEIIRAAKKRVGPDFPICILINGIELGIDNGITIEDAQEFSKMFVNAGADAIHVRSYGYNQYEIGWLMHRLEHFFYPEKMKTLPKEFDWSNRGAGAQVPLAAAIKKVVSVPVIAVGRLDPDLGERVLQQGKADFIGMTRRLLADPDLPRKVASGRLDEVRHCLACDTCSEQVIGPHITCRVNAALGTSEDYQVGPAPKKKAVLVVGSGPGGMEAARVAALRGHKVTLFEKGHILGGLLPMAAVVKGIEIENLPTLVRYYQINFIKLGVDVKLGKAVTMVEVEQLKPDVIIVAEGGTIAIPQIRGINRHNVVTSLKLHKMIKPYLRFFSPRALGWLTKFWIPIGKRVVVIGGKMNGCEVAEFLVKRGRQVTIVEEGKTLGDGMVELNKMLFFPWLKEKGVKTLTEMKYEEINDKGLTIIDPEGDNVTIEADTIVTALPSLPNIELFESLKEKAKEVYAIGDCKKPGLIVDAIADGFRIAKSL